MPLYKDQDRTYHGIQQYESAHDDQEWQPARLQVEQAEFGPTGHKDVTVLRRFDVPEDSGSGWGYNGGGTSHTAAAILADALDVDDDWFGVSGDPLNETDKQLREDFCEDVLSQMCDEFRLRRGAVLRWVRGWYAEQQITDLPAAVATLPPINRGDYQ